MGKKSTPVWLSIFMAAFIVGMLFGIGVRTGISPDEGSISILILGTFCDAIEEVDESGSTFNAGYNCKLFLFVMIVVSFIVGILAVWEEATRMKDWRIGLGIYVVGWLAGFIFILANT